MSKYVYPAIFTPEDGGFSVYFPDVKNCFTQGNTLAEAIDNAQDALCAMLYEYEENNEEIKNASDITAVKVENSNGEFISLISCDTMDYRRFYENKAVKKTLSIPSWLNALAEKEGLNFSQILQKGLKEQLGVK